MLASVEAFDSTPFLLIGIALLAVLLVVQMIWAYRKASESGEGSGPVSAKLKSNPETGSDPDSASATGVEEGMMICPECGKPTEVEYRLCRHCVEDTGRSHAGSGGDGGSRSSGMF